MPRLLSQRLCICSLLLFCAAAARAQDNRVEQAREVGRINTQPDQPSGNSRSLLPDGAADGDDGSFGVQQVLQETDKPQPLSGFADLSAMFTDNVALTRHNTKGDAFLVSMVGVEYRRSLPLGLQLDAGVSFSAFRYNSFRQFDFNSVDAGIGFSYHTAKLGGVDLNLGYDFTNLSAKSGKGFFNNHAIDLNAQKTLAFSQAQYAFAGLSAEIGFADPRITQRSEFSVFAGYHLQAARRWDADLLYRYAYYAYAERGRGDNNQTITLGTRYSFTDWFSVYATSYLVVNLSNQDVFNYVAGTVGGGVTFKLSF